MAHEQATAGSSAGALPKRNAKHQKRKKMKGKRGSSQMDSPHKKNKPASDDELADHVSSMYITGPGGFMKEAAIKREKDKFDNERMDFLKKLDRHPTLVLNADYQVGIWYSNAGDTKSCNRRRILTV